MENFNYVLLDTSNEYQKQIQLRNSQYLILNWGGNHFINGNFSLYDTNKPILIVCHYSYNHEYSKIKGYSKNGILDNIDFKNKIRYIFDIPDEIENLDKIIEDFDLDIYRNLNYDELIIHYQNIGKNE
jgi:hypothetical protein